MVTYINAFQISAITLAIPNFTELGGVVSYRLLATATSSRSQLMRL